MADEKVTLYRDVNNGQAGMDPDFQRWFPKTIDEAVLLTDDGSSSTETNLKTRLANLKATISNLEQEAKTLTSTVNQIKHNYILKSMMSNTQVNDTNKVPTSALVNNMNNAITQINSDLNSAKTDSVYKKYEGYGTKLDFSGIEHQQGLILFSPNLLYAFRISGNPWSFAWYKLFGQDLKVNATFDGSTVHITSEDPRGILVISN